MTTTVSALSKILVILKSTGCFPFYSYLNNYRLKQTRKFWKSYSLGIFLITQISASFFLYAAISDWQLWFPYKLRSPTDNTNQLFEVILCVTVYALMQLLCVFNFSRFIEILNAILDIELDLKRKFRRELTNKKLEAYNTAILVYIVAYVIFMVVICVERITKDPNNATAIMYMFEMAMSASYVVFFTSLVKLTVVRLKIVNNLFQSVSETPDDDLKLFFQVVEIYKLVEKTFGMIDDSNGLILLFYLAYVFYTLTNEIYSFAFLILLNHTEMWDYISSMFWIIHQVWVLWELSMNCGVVPGEAKKTAQILARVYGKGKDYQNMIDKFLTKSIKQEIKFTAYGFFVIDNSTLFKIVSAVTTYLVILIQFKQLEDSKTSSTTTSPTTTDIA